MLLAVDVASRALLHTTDHDVILRVGGGVEMFSYGKPTRLVRNTAELLTEMFP